MKNKIIYISFILTILSTGYLSADVDPFSRSFTQQSSGDQTQMSSSPASGDASVHPMVRLSIEQYFVKGVVTSSKGSLAIISFPGGDDYFLYVGDLIGNDSHSLKSISTDKITVSKEDAEDTEILVFNPNQTVSGMDNQ
jgi:Tfp pilus assembly protein PilP|tara:strand:+ start:121 stop:537 length:417 start_codon:yes stop_codon:yes gene_type:complete